MPRKIKIPMCEYCGKPRGEHIYPEWDVHQLKKGDFIKTKSNINVGMRLIAKQDRQMQKIAKKVFGKK